MTCEIRQIKHEGGAREAPASSRDEGDGVKRRDIGYYARFRVIALFSAILYCTVIEEQSIEHARTTWRYKKHPSLHHLWESAPGESRAHRISRKYLLQILSARKNSGDLMRSANRDNNRDTGEIKRIRDTADTIHRRRIEEICCQISRECFARLALLPTRNSRKFMSALPYRSRKCSS